MTVEISTIDEEANRENVTPGTHTIQTATANFKAIGLKQCWYSTELFQNELCEIINLTAKLFSAHVVTVI